MSYTSAEAARALNVTPKELRRIIRKSPTFNNAGVGGRYTFTDADLAALGRLVAEHHTRTRKAPQDAVEDRPGISVEFMKRAQRDPRLRAQQMAFRADRQARLSELVKAAR